MCFVLLNMHNAQYIISLTSILQVNLFGSYIFGKHATVENENRAIMIKQWSQCNREYENYKNLCMKILLNVTLFFFNCRMSLIIHSVEVIVLNRLKYFLIVTYAQPSGDIPPWIGLPLYRNFFFFAFAKSGTSARGSFTSVVDALWWIRFELRTCPLACQQTFC